MAPKYVLNYFPVAGRAEAARLMFKVAGVDFTDNMISYTDWPNVKSDTKRFPLNQMPTLEVDGKVICQSAGIYRYIANELGQYGESNLEKADIDQICETLRDILPKFTKVIFYDKDLTDEEKDKKCVAMLEDDETKKALNFIFSFLKANNEGKGFLVGNKISLADFFVHSVDSVFVRFKPAYKDDYPEAKGLIDRINAIEAVKKHNEEKKY